LSPFFFSFFFLAGFLPGFFLLFVLRTFCVEKHKWIASFGVSALNDNNLGPTFWTLRRGFDQHMVAAS
jgi:hypothetical protein